LLKGKNKQSKKNRSYLWVVFGFDEHDLKGAFFSSYCEKWLEDYNWKDFLQIQVQWKYQYFSSVYSKIVEDEVTCANQSYLIQIKEIWVLIDLQTLVFL